MPRSTARRCSQLLRRSIVDRPPKGTDAEALLVVAAEEGIGDGITGRAAGERRDLSDVGAVGERGGQLAHECGQTTVVAGARSDQSLVELGVDDHLSNPVTCAAVGTSDVGRPCTQCLVDECEEGDFTDVGVVQRQACERIRVARAPSQCGDCAQLRVGIVAIGRNGLEQRDCISSWHRAHRVDQRDAPRSVCVRESSGEGPQDTVAITVRPAGERALRHHASEPTLGHHGSESIHCAAVR